MQLLLATAAPGSCLCIPSPVSGCVLWLIHYQMMSYKTHFNPPLVLKYTCQRYEFFYRCVPEIKAKLCCSHSSGSFDAKDQCCRTQVEKDLSVTQCWSQGTQTKHCLNTPPGGNRGVNCLLLCKGDIWLLQNRLRVNQHAHMGLLGAKWAVNQAKRASCTKAGCTVSPFVSSEEGKMANFFRSKAVH